MFSYDEARDGDILIWEAANGRCTAVVTETVTDEGAPIKIADTGGGRYLPLDVLTMCARLVKPMDK